MRIDYDSLNNLSSRWTARIREAEQAKEKVFGARAKELWRFFGEPQRELLFEDQELGVWRAVINKVREYVDIYLPYLLQRHPRRVVNVRRPPIPRDLEWMAALLGQQGSWLGNERIRRASLDVAATLLEWWLNYLVGEYDLFAETRLAIIEALVKGRGVVWHVLSELNGIMDVPISVWDSVDNLLIDPDAQVLRDATWIARRRELTKREIAALIGVYESTLDHYLGRDESGNAAKVERYRDTRSNFYEVYEIWSRIGVDYDKESVGQETRDLLETSGQHVWLVLMPSIGRILNLLPEVILDDETRFLEALRWPIETYANTMDPWPFTALDFHPQPSCVWPSSPLEPGIPYQRMLDECYHYVYSAAMRSLRRVVLVPASADTEITDALTGKDAVTAIRVPVHTLLDKANLGGFYHVVDFPGINSEVMAYIQMLEMQFAKAVGLDDIMYGAPPQRQIRSATEAQLRFSALSGRPKAKRDDVDYWLARIATKEGMLSRLYVPAAAVSGLFGESVVETEDGQVLPGGPLGAIWSTFIFTSNPYHAARDFEFSIVQESTSPEGTETRIQRASFLLQTVLPAVVQLAKTTGDFDSVKTILSRVGSAIGVDLSFLESSPHEPSAGHTATSGRRNGSAGQEGNVVRSAERGV